MKRQVKLLPIMIIVGIAVLVGYNLTRQRARPLPPQIVEEGVYQLGNIIVDTISGEIRFDAEVQKREGWAQHLIYLQGYKWLKEESAITADAKLVDLQKAIALLDWELWDELWHEKQVTSNQLPVIREKELLLFIQWNEEEITAQELVLTDDKLEIGDFIFMGSPYFDHMVLEAHAGADCRLCPIFPLKEETLKELFIRESGQSGYELNSSLFPPEETEVTVVIQISKIFDNTR